MACFGSVFAGSRQVYFFEETITLSDRKHRNMNFLMAEQPGTNVSRIAQDLGLDPSVLRRWVGQMRGGTWEPAPGKPLKSAQQQEIEQLRRELAKASWPVTGRTAAPGYGGICAPGASTAAGIAWHV